MEAEATRFCVPQEKWGRKRRIKGYRPVSHFRRRALSPQVPPYPGLFPFTLAPGPEDFASGDLNGDGVLDVAAINYSTSRITVILSKNNEHKLHPSGANEES
jgi:hypothetical protein